MATGRRRWVIRLFATLWTVIVVVLKASAVALAVITPLIGVWVSSSLAAYLNGPLWLAILVGLLFFPLLPLVWDGLSSWRRSRKEVARERILTFTDRLVLRTLFLNLALIAAILAARPEVGFTALQARGDWMLDSPEGEWADEVRPWLFAAADRLEWVYDLAHENPYAEVNPDEGVTPGPPRPEGDPRGRAPLPTPGKRPDNDSGEGGQDEPSSDRGGGDRADHDNGQPDNDSEGSDRDDGGEDNERSEGLEVLWPTPAKVHPVAASMPRSAETSIDAVADYIGERVNDPVGRIRAAHDWVADRISYDVAALEARRIPPQNPEKIFRERIGVCAGYSLLLRSLGQKLGLEVVYVTGNSRKKSGDVSGLGHAWNAVKLGDSWHLIDATWNAGSVNDGEFEKRYNTRYFLAPPEVFGLNHLPDEPRWQLRERPISRGAFIRQPMLDPRFFMQKLRLVDPRRSQITVEDEAVIRVANPDDWFMLASYSPLTSSNDNSRQRCQVEQGRAVRVNCRFEREGAWRVQLFTNRQRYGSFTYVGQILVNSD